MKVYTENEIKEFAKEIYNMNPTDEISDSLWEKIQIVAAYVKTQADKKTNNIN